MDDVRNNHVPREDAEGDEGHDRSASSGRASRMEDRYELNRIVQEIRGHVRRRRRRQPSTATTGIVVTPVIVSVALQFPESWIGDAPFVCQKLERRWKEACSEEEPRRNDDDVGCGDDDDTCNSREHLHLLPDLFVFCVGDSNDDDCCPDVDGARHLPNTQFLVQFGPHALCHHPQMSMSLSKSTSKSIRRGDVRPSWQQQDHLQQQSESATCCTAKPPVPEEDGRAAHGCCDSNGKNSVSSSCCDPNSKDPGKETDADVNDSGLIVLRAFGKLPLNAVEVVNGVQSALVSRTHHTNDETLPPPTTVRSRKFLLLYDVRYRDAMDELSTLLSETLDALVLVGHIPSTQGVGGGDDSYVQDVADDAIDYDGRIVVAGGLVLPSHRLVDWASSYTLLYVGDPSSLQFLHISLRLQGTGIDRDNMNSNVVTCDPRALSSSGTLLHDKIDANRSQEPSQMAVSTGWLPQLSKFLKRRYYLVQKAKSASTVGIVVAANVGGGAAGAAEGLEGSTSPVHQVMNALMRMLLDHGKSPYLYSVGRNVTVAKLTNFVDLVECFVYVACPYGTLRILQALDHQISVPIVSPMEMAMALGLVEWNHCRIETSNGVGPSPFDLGYSVDWDDFLHVANASTSSSSDAPHRASSVLDLNAESQDTDQDDDDEDDAPYFSLVTGRYESRSSSQASRPVDVDLTALPGQGVLTRHVSSAAEALQRREYQGLRPDIGETEVQAAIPGQKGIASNYGNR